MSSSPPSGRRLTVLALLLAVGGTAAAQAPEASPPTPAPPEGTPPPGERPEPVAPPAPVSPPSPEKVFSGAPVPEVAQEEAEEHSWFDQGHAYFGRLFFTPVFIAL